MSSQRISGKDASTIVAAGGNIDTTSTSINIENMQVVVQEGAFIVTESLPASARPEAEKAVSQMNDQLLNLVRDHAPEAASEFSRPRMIAATQRAQQACIEAEDDEALAQKLAAMLLELARSDRQTIKGRAIKAALECLPNLSDIHANAIATRVIMGLNSPSIETVDDMIEMYGALLSPFYGAIPTTSSEYDYIASTGVGSISNLGIKPFDQLISEYRYVAQKFADRSSIRDIELIDEIHIEKSPLDADKVRFTRNAVNIMSNPGNEEGMRTVRMGHSSIKMKPEEVTEAIREADPSLFDFLTTLQETRALDFNNNAAGKAIGVLVWQSKDPVNAISLDRLLSF